MLCHWVSSAWSRALAQSGHLIHTCWIGKVPHPSEAICFPGDSHHRAHPAYQMCSSHRTQNVHHVPSDTVIWTVSFSSLRWVPNPWPACPDWLPSFLLQRSAHGKFPGGRATAICLKGHESTWPTWQPASNKPAFLRRVSGIKMHRSHCRPGSWRSCPSTAHTRPPTTISCRPQCILFSAVEHTTVKDMSLPLSTATEAKCLSVVMSK